MPRAEFTGDELRPQEWHEVTAPPPELATAAGALAAGFGAGTLATGELRRLVEELAARTDLWQPLVISDRRRRRYRLLFEDPRLDVWVLSWMPGQKTGFHDHGASNVVAHGSPGKRSGAADAPRRGEHRTRARPGGVPAGRRPATSTRSRMPAVEPAVTLHAYSPPLVDVGQYRAGPAGEVLRERQHGRQELLDNTLGA